MRKAYFLSSCDTCKRILKELPVDANFDLQDLKEKPITEEELQILFAHSKSYAQLINKRAKLYRDQDLKNKTLTESDCKALLLSHYTFLKRPVFRIDDKIFIGNSKKTIQEVHQAL